MKIIVQKLVTEFETTPSQLTVFPFEIRRKPIPVSPNESKMLGRECYLISIKDVRLPLPLPLNRTWRAEGRLMCSDGFIPFLSFVVGQIRKKVYVSFLVH